MPAAQDASSTVVWLRNRLRMSVSAARRLVVLAAGLAAGPAVLYDQAFATAAELVAHCETLRANLGSIATTAVDAATMAITTRKSSHFTILKTARMDALLAFFLPHRPWICLHSITEIDRPVERDQPTFNRITTLRHNNGDRARFFLGKAGSSWTAGDKDVYLKAN